MLKIKVPQSFFAEREYVIHVLFGELLEVEFQVLKSDIKDIEIVLPNESKVTLVDSFFIRTTEKKGYLGSEFLPSQLMSLPGSICGFYGDASIEKKDSGCRIRLDIIASSFFMLSRWEEALPFNGDRHKRFCGKASKAYHFGVLNRPLVNEYAKYLKDLLLEMGYANFKNEKKFRVFVTHDVDSIHYWFGLKHFIRSFFGDILKRKKIKLALFNLWRYLRLNLGWGKDPFDTFDYIMDISESFGFRSHFYFLGAGDTIFDQNYKIQEDSAKKIANKIKKRSHEIGIHPSYNSYNSKEIFAKEHCNLEHHFGVKITEGRQHYLRMEIPETWNLWEDQDLKVDSSMSYHDVEGFRCGICSEFPVFDIRKRKTLKLRERPLTIMECTLLDYRKMSLDEALETIYRYIDIVKAHKGDFVFLWHNSSFESFKAESALFEKTLKYARHQCESRQA